MIRRIRLQRLAPQDRGAWQKAYYSHQKFWQRRRLIVLSKVSALRSHGVTWKQSLFDVNFGIFIYSQVIDFTYTKKLFLESYLGRTDPG